MFLRPPFRLVPLGPVLLLLTACDATVHVDLGVNPPPTAVASMTLGTESVQLLTANGVATLAATHRLEWGDDADGSLSALASEDSDADARYTGLRLQFNDDDAEVVLAHGGRVGLQLDDPARYADLDLKLKAGDEANIILVMDLRFSLIDRRDDLGLYQLRPVVRAAVANNVGHLNGTVALNLLQHSDCRQGRPLGQGVAAYVYAGKNRSAVDYYDNGTVARQHPPMASAPVRYDADRQTYGYAADFLPPGEYTVALTCQADAEHPQLDDALVFVGTRNVTITADAASTAHFGD